MFEQIKSTRIFHLNRLLTFLSSPAPSCTVSYSPSLIRSNVRRPFLDFLPTSVIGRLKTFTCNKSINHVLQKNQLNHISYLSQSCHSSDIFSLLLFTECITKTGLQHLAIGLLILCQTCFVSFLKHEWSQLILKTLFQPQ